MSTEKFITCSCGSQNSARAFRCHSCEQVFDGSAGNSIPLSRCVTVPNRPVPANSSRNSQQNLPSIPREWAGRPVAQNEKPEVLVAIVGFSDTAEVRQSPVPLDKVCPYKLTPDAATNEAAGLRLAGDLWEKHMSHGRLNLVFLGDGEPTAGGGIFGDDKKAALEEADELKQKGARIATIGVSGPTMDFRHLQSLASSPALAFEAQVGGIASVFVHATHSVTSHRWGQTGAEFVVFVIDESGSMGEENKKTEVEEAVAASVALLQRL